MGNTIINPKQYLYGIYLLSNSNFNNVGFNTITTFKQDGYAIYSVDSTSNNFTNNNINTFNMNGHGIYLFGYSNNNLVDNHINTSGKYSYGIYLYNSKDNYLTGNYVNTFGDEAFCIHLSFSNNNILTHNIIKTTAEEDYGIALWNSDKNILTANNIRTLGLLSYGFNLGYYSDNNDMIENRVETSGEKGYGIRLYQSSFNNLINNNINTSAKHTEGIYLEESTDNNIINNRINSSAGGHGIFLNQASNNNELLNATISTSGASGHGIFCKGSNNNQIINNNITTTGSNAHGCYAENLNVVISNTTISTSSTLDSYDLKATLDGNITTINCSFKTVHLTDNGGGTLKVKNYLDIQVYDDDGITPLSGVDVDIRDNDMRIYASAGYGGTDNTTDVNGRVESILVMDRWYNYNNIATENITAVQVKKMFDKLWETERPEVDMNTSHTEIFYFDITPPPIPTGLKVTRVPKTNTINISWDPNLDTFNYEVRTNKSGSWTLLDLVTHPQTWTFDEGLEEKTRYYYKIQAWDKSDLFSGFSEVVSYYHPDSTPPIIPTGLTAIPVPGGDALNISWDLNFDDTVHYDLWWSIPRSGEWVQLFNISHPTNWLIWSNESLINGTIYYFKLRAWDKAGLCSAFSPLVNVVHMDYVPPIAPSNLRAETLSGTMIKLSWSSSIDSDVECYRVYINQSGAGSTGPYILQDEVTTLSYQFSDLLENTRYYFVVSALDEANNTSPYSNEAWNTTIGVSERPRVLSTIPENNSQDVAVDCLVTITFNIPMDTTSVERVLSISPPMDYNLHWTKNYTVLRIEFIDNLDYAMAYLIKLGEATARNGGILEDAPFVLSFKTEIEDGIQPSPSISMINITSPAANTTVKPGESIKVSGSSFGFFEGSQIIVTLENTTKTGIIGAHGTWLVTMTAPATEGNYTITISVGNLNHLIPITVKDTQEPQDGGDDTSSVKDHDALNIIYLGMLIVIIAIILVIIGIVFLIRKKKCTQVAEEGEYEKEYEYEDYYEDERDYDRYEEEEHYEDERYLDSDEDENEEEWEEEEWDLDE